MENQPTLAQLHERALKEHWALPHFNFSSLAQLHGIMDAVAEARTPVAIGTSEGERKFVGLAQAVYLRDSFRFEYGLPVFLNADHTRDVALAFAAVDAGYDSIHIDLSKLPLEKNIEETKRVVAYAKGKNPDSNIEGELGYIVTDSSKVYKEVVEVPPQSYTKVEEAVRFVEETGVDRLAPAVGTLHGIAANKPIINFELVKALRAALPDRLALVLHGGSGVADEDLRRVVQEGFNNAHISTELRVAYTAALRATLAAKPDEVAPYHYLSEARLKTAAVARQKIELFNAVGVMAAD
jgi:fructose-bisphosphate aldolase, class II